MTAPSVGIYTLGCKVNQYESRAMAEEFLRRGYILLDHSLVCDVYVINTCTVTGEADRKARQFIRRAISENPDAAIIVCGCLSQRDPKGVAAISGVDSVIGNVHKMSAVDEADRILSEKAKAGAEKRDCVPRIALADIDDAPFESMHVSSFERTRAYIKIEDGCESRCAYCVIPSVRGRIRSKPRANIISEAAELAAAGFREIVLTGIETGSWGKDIGSEDLCGLLEELNGTRGLERIRLGSLDPSFMTKERIDRISVLENVAPHFHLSLQSGCDRTLAAMRRRYNTGMMLERMEYLRDKMPDVTFTTDVMTGFPGETDKDFDTTCRFMERAKFLSAHIFTYSRRPGTEADRMPGQVPEHIKSERAAALEKVCRETGERIRSAFIGREMPVLFETCENGTAVGHTPNYLRAAVKSDRDLRGEIMTVKLTSLAGQILNAIPVSSY